MNGVNTVRLEAELRALVDISTPNGDNEAAEAAFAEVTKMLPGGVTVERLNSSSEGHAPSMLASLKGTGTGRLLLLGHIDTVFSHDEHRPAEVVEDRTFGSGTIDMKGGDAIALEVMRRLAADLDGFGEIALLIVADEEWRTVDFVHGPAFAEFDACLCFEAGERDDAGSDAVILRRKAAATLRVRATGLAAHSGAAPDDGRNALLALAKVAQDVSKLHEPDGPLGLTAVPTIIQSGDAINVVPASGELNFDLRANSADSFAAVVDSIPTDSDGVKLDASLTRVWPGMDSRESAAAVLASAATQLKRPIIAGSRGGASDASHLAVHIPLTIDGLGPIGAGAHTGDEYVETDTLGSRAELALAVARAALPGDAASTPDEV